MAREGLVVQYCGPHQLGISSLYSLVSVFVVLLALGNSRGTVGVFRNNNTWWAERHGGSLMHLFIHHRVQDSRSAIFWSGKKQKVTTSNVLFFLRRATRQKQKTLLNRNQNQVRRPAVPRNSDSRPPLPTWERVTSDISPIPTKRSRSFRDLDLSEQVYS